MYKTRFFSILAIGLLILQLFGTHTSLYVNAKTSDDSNKIEVNYANVNEAVDEITWQVIINPSKSESEDFETNVLFDTGMTHKDINLKKEQENVTIKKEADGYTIGTPEGNDMYEIEIVTKIEDKEKTLFQLRAVVEEENEKYEATDEVEIEREEPIEEKSKKKQEVLTENNQDDKKTDKEKSSAKKEETDNLEKAKETENSINEKEGSEQKEDKKKNDELNEKEALQIEDEEVGEPSLSTFSASENPVAILGEKPGEKWPNPGSLKLEKTAEETNGFNEWEVELNVEGKNLKTSSDIVIVFDRSNSMIEGNREAKAKAAAKGFVNSLLVDQDSTVRIALIPFGSDTGTQYDPHTDFQAYSGKNTLLTAIDAIQIYSTHQSGGTNIHAGLHAAEEKLSNSTADQRTIVLMSDGEPTYSLKAQDYDSYSWPGNKYDFILKDFDYKTRVGNGTAGNSPNYGVGAYSCGSWLFPRTCYQKQVRSHVLPTISEAKYIMDSGVGMYSVGLEVGNVPDAIYTLQNSQNKGYYQGGAEDMSPIFEEIAASIGFAATNAVATDPLGEMFDLVKDGSYSGADFQASHGTATWDDTSETFTWDIGNVKEDEVYTLTYKVTLDCSKDPEANVKYPTNKETPLNYTNYNGNNATKQFPIPEVSIHKGKIDKLGYRVNVDGDPVDSSGDIVASPAEAETFYKEQFGDHLTLNNTYSVPAGDTPNGYQLHVGDDPTEVNLTTICTTVAFGYVKTSELPAGKVIAAYVDEAGNEIASSEEFEGHIDEEYRTKQKDISGYEFVKMHDDSADATGAFTTEEQTVIYVYKQLQGTIKLIKVDEADQAKKLAVAKFAIKDGDGNEIGILETDENGEAVSEALPIGDYTLEEIKAPYGYELSTDQALTIKVKANKEIKITVTNKQLKGSIKIIKVDAEDNSILLPGATFELQNEAGDTVATGTTNKDGEYVFLDVVVGKYELVETKAPEDYRLLNKPIEVEITPGQLTVTKTIENSQQGWGIPDTGGIGTLGFYSIGLLLMTIAGFYFFRKGRV